MSAIITVHGYNSDPASKKWKDRPDGQQREFAKALSPHHAHPFNWFSAIQGKFSHILKAWSKGYPTTYHWAYEELALKAADAFLDKHEGCAGLNVFAHSLGSRVVLQAINKNPAMFDRVCFINAAERTEIAEIILNKAPNVKVLNCCVWEDDVLDKAAGYMSPGRGKELIMGQDGLLNIHDNFTEVLLDNPHDREVYREKYGFDLRGNDPDSFGDHHFSYQHRGNWPLYQAFFNDEL